MFWCMTDVVLCFLATVFIGGLVLALIINIYDRLIMWKFNRDMRALAKWKYKENGNGY